jgi:hypothetical protein
MGLFRRNSHDIIHVRYLDAANGKVFAQVKLPISKLPESFEASATLHRGEEDWQVIEARPVTAAEFRRTGQLLLVVRKITIGLMDPLQILFSLPTIANDALPPIALGTTKIGIDAIEIQEDDWRQIEWVPASIADIVETEFGAIRHILENEQQGPGFRKCHARVSVSTVAFMQINFAQLQAALGPKAGWLAGFAYQGIVGLVENSFAVRLLSSIELFGIVTEGVTQSICFANTRSNNVPMPDLQNLADFAAARDLMLVDWPQLTVLEPDIADYKKYFCRDNR